MSDSSYTNEPNRTTGQINSYVVFTNFHAGAHVAFFRPAHISLPLFSSVLDGSATGTAKDFAGQVRASERASSSRYLLQVSLTGLSLVLRRWRRSASGRPASNSARAAASSTLVSGDLSLACFWVDG